MMLSFMLFSPLLAHFFDTKDEGWHFYHDRTILSTKEDKTAPKTMPKNSPKSLKELKKQAEELLEEAVWNPTLQNIGRYQRIQKHIMDKSERFAHVWAENLLLEPDLDNTIDDPTSYYGVLAQKEEAAHRKKRNIQRIAAHFALVLVIEDSYLSRNLHRIVKNMVAEHKIPLIVIDARYDAASQKAQWHIKRIPALLMVEKTSGHFSTITYALHAQDELEKRMMHVLKNTTHSIATIKEPHQ